MLNLDTHILLYALHGRLEAGEQRLLIDDGNWGISAIVLWEIEKLYQKGRIIHGLDYAPLAAALQRLCIWPLTPEVCFNLRRLDFASDPADEIIAATSLTHDVPLVTRDTRIRVSKLTPLAKIPTQGF
jgi:PIN domain nuclease of toxin-antitoxin system